MSSSKARRSIGLFSPSKNGGLRQQRLAEGDSPSLNNESDVPLNDDDAEKLQRKQDKVLELHLQNSPIRSSRRQSLQQSHNSGVGGLTSAQLAEQYANCIKLSTENKITIKNAFGLHLIDYMALMLKKKDPEMNNLPVASLTLDASTKIYGCRVDSVHADTFKMASGFSRSSKMKNKQDEDGGDGDEGGRRVKKKREKSHTIEQNLKALDMNKLDLQFEVDPLFRKTTEMFAEMGSAGSHLLSILRSRDDSCELLLDPATVLDRTRVDVQARRNSWTDLSEIKALFDESKWGSLKICPTFSGFEFGTWSLDDDQTKDRSSVVNNEVLPENETDDSVAEMRNDFGGSLDHNAEDGGDEDLFKVVEDNPEIRLLPPLSDNCELPSMSFDATNLVQVLASEPSEYSYFDEQLLTAWAGPQHWRPFPRLKVERTDDVIKDSKPRAKKAAFRIDYSKEVDFKKHFRAPRSDVQLSKPTINHWSEDVTTLPEDLHYKTARLLQLFLRPSTVIHGRKIATNNEDDESLTEYDYNNPNDVENFVPAPNVADVSLSPGGAHFPDMTEEFSRMESQPLAGGGQAMLAFAGDNLVPEPRKVAKFSIPYACAAKKINVKRLKISIWKLLCTSDEEINTPAGRSEQNNVVETAVRSLVTGEKSFIELYDKLPNSLPTQMTVDLSEHIAFVCLLHLANEKNLFLIHQQDLRDFHICQCQ